MRRFGLLMFALPLLAPPSLAQDGWISLFNGKDLTGWKIGGGPATFQVIDGALTTTSGPVAHAFYDGPAHDFKNFELSVDLQAGPNSNGGIYFHTEFQDRGFPRKGFEVQVNNTYSTDPIKTGSLYHVVDLPSSPIGDNQWYTTLITVRDNTITVAIDGRQVVRWTQTPEWNGGREGPGRVIGRGTIALQAHDPSSRVAYKNIRIRPLP